MSGEKSKSSGEFGEKIVSNFFKLIGWSGVEEGITIECVFHEEHARPSKKHGIDAYFRYKSELMKSNTQEDVLVSIKHTANKYPSSPNSIFKSHLKDLAYAMECFPYDKDYVGRKLPSGIQDRNLSGVIFWISQEDDDRTDLISKVCNFNNTDKIDYGPIYLVDNNKLSFLYNSIKYVQKHFDDYDFEYHKTGFNNNPAEFHDYGKVLPVQLINTNILPIRFFEESSSGIAVFLNEPFSEESLIKVVGFTKLISKDWPEKVYIFYSDYNKLTHSNIVERVRSNFTDTKFKSKIYVKSFIDSIATLGGE
ncbi:Uncharacterised protein [Lysinibacillus sphaericus]|nr:Uncharacterised protein [Lysinibacillus sphaericus]